MTKTTLRNLRRPATARLTREQWQAIRTIWEYDLDQPSYNAAAGRAAKKYQFAPPGKSTIDDRAKKVGWERRGSMNGINAAAQRKADTLTDSCGNRTAPDAKKAHFPGASSSYLVLASREESENKRAEVNARHRTEWMQIAVLRQEALALRNPNLNQAMVKMKLVKTAAQTTAIQQSGERKAWGLNVQMDVGSLKDMTDAQLEAIINGKVAY
jgi:hypothetical protein